MKKECKNIFYSFAEMYKRSRIIYETAVEEKPGLSLVKDGIIIEDMVEKLEGGRN